MIGKKSAILLLWMVRSRFLFHRARQYATQVAESAIIFIETWIGPDEIKNLIGSPSGCPNFGGGTFGRIRRVAIERFGGNAHGTPE